MTNIISGYFMKLMTVYRYPYSLIDNKFLNTEYLAILYGVPFIISMYLLFAKQNSVNGVFYELFAVIMSFVPFMFVTESYFLRNTNYQQIVGIDTIALCLMFFMTSMYFIYILCRLFIRLKERLNIWKRGMIIVGLIYTVSLIPIYIRNFVILVSYYL
ncbi:hypothetical protein [Microaceticoccus formicicus]|uniref:hypothetical protein n=1 Tax=Microaceticoccus formicicus TaxID=3118105 RepID=UPI003CD02A56|nr:hypothetical protein VZL98_03215 [Peptoniphilaceae bacterium AMB_02]